MDKMNTTMPFVTKSAGISRLSEVGRFYAMSQVEQDRYIKENFDDVVVIKDVINLKMQESRAEGMAQGRAEGLAEGERQKALDTAAKMKLRGYTVDVIADITGLDPDEIAKI